MQSRQILGFGFIGATVLILFTVIFFGRDFYDLYRNYANVHTTYAPSDDETIVMEAEAVKALQRRVEDESEAILKAIGEKNATQSAVSAANAAENESATTENVAQQKATKTSADTKSRIDITEINRRIHKLLSASAFFQHSMALTPQNLETLDRISKLIADLPKEYDVEVEGHTEKGLSASVSADMAGRVATRLRKNLADRKIGSVGYGDRYPISDDPYARINRRVEIIVRRNED